MKKLTIVGRGTVGVMAVAHFIKWTDWVIDWIYDPSILPTSVGEGTNLTLPRSLAQNVDFDGVLMDKILATQKMGIWKRDWGTSGDFIHTFPAGLHGMHFSAETFQEYFLNKLIENNRVNVIQQNCKNYEELDSDFIMVCTGSPEKLTSEYVNRTDIPVNTATVFQCPWDYVKFNYSLTFARKHGWVFGIPLKNRCSIGYVYNSIITNENDIVEDVQEVLKEFELIPTSTRTLSFNNYTRKQNFSERIVYNGNASFFLEPLEATSTGTADLIIRRAFELWNGHLTLESANKKYTTEMDDIESMILLHYFAGSIHNTKFWSFAEKLSTDKLKNVFKKDEKFSNIIKTAINYESRYFPYSDLEVGTWPVRSYVQNINGMKIKEKLLNLI